MITATRSIIPSVVSLHLEEAAMLRSTRSVLVRAPHVKLFDLARSDERLAAHLDGLLVAADHGLQLSEEAAAAGDAGQLFVAAVLAIERRDETRLGRLTGLVGRASAASHALASAFGWVTPSSLRGLIGPLLSSASPAARRLGVAACAQHRVDPGAPIDRAIADEDSLLRARALRAAGELGRIELLPACMACLDDDDVSCRLAAAWSGVLLGGRAEVMTALRVLAIQPGTVQLPALAMSLLASDVQAAREQIQHLAAQNVAPRTVIKAVGWAGDPQAVPWLLKQMEGDLHARVAGEAFGLITGADLAQFGLARPQPQASPEEADAESRDEGVALDEDEGLPWPDLEKLTAWWQSHRAHFDGGDRYFVGEVASIPHCIAVLKGGAQRQRIAASLHLSVAQPGTPLFNVAAPARRQRRLLSQMEV